MVKVKRTYATFDNPVNDDSIIDVLVFMRIPETFCFLRGIDILWREKDSVLLIVKKSWYDQMRNYIIKTGSDIIKEIQLIKPKKSGI